MSEHGLVQPTQDTISAYQKNNKNNNLPGYFGYTLQLFLNLVLLGLGHANHFASALLSDNYCCQTHTEPGSIESRLILR